MNPKIRLYAFVKATRRWIFVLRRPLPLISILLIVGIVSLGLSIVRADRPSALTKIVPLTGTTTVPAVTVDPPPADQAEPDESTQPAEEETKPEEAENPAVVIPEESEEDQQWQTVRMRVTAYCPCRYCCGKNSDGYTACMHKIKQGDVFVAADKKYKFRTEVIVPGYNDDQPVKVLDRGRVIKGDRLDIFFNSHKTAKKWGVQYLDVKVKK